jgi:elongator complex protein 4
VPQPSSVSSSNASAIFCHDFDLSKRIILPSPSNMHFVSLSAQPDMNFKDPDPSLSPFTKFINHLSTQLANSAPTTVHRVAVPSLLTTAIYPAHSSTPSHVLQFLHSLRALLRKYPTQLTALITLPLTLYPRSTGLTRWIELLSDGVLELAPFPTSAIAAKPPGASTVHEEPPQGMLNVHRLPIFHERGGGGGEAGGFGDDLAFTLSRRKGMVIKPFSLPPVEGDTEAQQGGLESEGGGKATKVDIEF